MDDTTTKRARESRYFEEQFERLEDLIRRYEALVEAIARIRGLEQLLVDVLDDRASSLDQQIFNFDRDMYAPRGELTKEEQARLRRLRSRRRRTTKRLATLLGE